MTNVPIEDCLNLLTSKHGTSDEIVKLVEVCLRTTFFVFQGEMIEQVQGAATVLSFVSCYSESVHGGH
jgi:hypothetical protein